MKILIGYDGSPFRSYLIPGLVLALAVGGSSIAGIAAIWSRHRFAHLMVLGSGVLLIGWITLQVLFIGYQGMLQPFVLITGILLCVLPWIGNRRANHLVSRGSSQDIPNTA